MTLYYGADSQTRTTVEVPRRTIPAAHRPPAGAPPLRFFEYITNRLRAARPADLANVEVPAFWGRYLNEGSHQRLGPLTGAEAQDIFSMSGGRCRILPIYNGDWRRESMVTGPRARDNGRASAKQAILLASTMNPRIPPTVRLYADLERWRVDSEWFLGWMEVMHRSEYPGIGGFYGNPLVWGSAMNNGVREYEGWSRNLVATAEGFSQQRFGALIAGLARGPVAAAPASTVAKIWSNRPYLNTGGQEMRPDRLFQRHFRPGLTPVSTMVETVIWQYGANIPFGLGRFATADMNVAKQTAYDEMWAGA